MKHEHKAYEQVSAQVVRVCRGCGSAVYIYIERGAHAYCGKMCADGAEASYDVTG
jgi:hypothetical protein